MAHITLENVNSLIDFRQVKHPLQPDSQIPRQTRRVTYVSEET